MEMKMEGRGCFSRWLLVCLLLQVSGLHSVVMAENETVTTQAVAASPDPTSVPPDVVTFDPPALLKVLEGTTWRVTWMTNYTGQVDSVWAEMHSKLEASVIYISDPIPGPPEDYNNTYVTGNVTYHGYVNVSAEFLGYTYLNVTLYDAANQTVAKGSMQMTVILAYQNLTNIFTILIAVIVGVAYFFMGATINLEVVKGIAKRPVGPLVGLFCQYGLMPVISFVLGLVMFPGHEFSERLMRLGLFLGGCCPGGGASNMWTVILGGSLDLSIMMTAVSTIFAFVSVPMWVLLMGPIIIADATFVIPFTDITVTVVSLLVPCGLGVALQIFYPKCIKYCEKVVAPISGVSILFTFTFGIYAYQFIFTLFTWRMLVSGFCLPAIGYLAGMSLGFVFGMPLERVIAISVETGVQNYTIAIIILNMTLVSPAGTLACAMPGASTLFTPLPLLTLLAVKKVYDRVKAGSLDISTPSDLKAVAKGSSTSTTTTTTTSLDLHHTKADKNGRVASPPPPAAPSSAPSTAATEGIDNPAADLRDTF